MINKFNKYDYYVVFTIALLVFGNMGNAIEPIRLLSILSVPYVLGKLFTTKLTQYQRNLLLFFIFWLCYSIFSIFWTTDIVEGFKELLYYYVHFSLFFLLIFWCQKANNPLKAIIYGWCTFFILTIPIALNEIINDYHLSSSIFKSDLTINLGNESIVQKKFAAVTFGNYNSYSLMLVFILPFIFSLLLFTRKVKYLILEFLLIGILVFLLLTNASRGAILCLLIVTMVFVYYYRKKTNKVKTHFNFLILLVAIGIGFYYSSELIQQLSYRFASGATFFEDLDRLKIYKKAWILFLNSNFLGTGIGSMVSSLQSISYGGILAIHNLFLEILMQFGLVIFAMFMFFLIFIYKKTVKINSDIIKFIIYSTLFSIFPFSVIDSGYLLAPSFWVLMASLFIIVTNKKVNKNIFLT